MKQPTEEMQRKYAQLQHMENTLQEAQAQIVRLESQVQELMNAKAALVSLGDTSEGTSILIPITNGMFVRAKLGTTDPVLVNVGADTIIDKPRVDAIKLLEQQEEQIIAAHERLITAYSQMEERGKAMEEELNRLIKIHEEH